MEVVGESILAAALEVLFGKLASPDLLKFARQEEIFAELEAWKKELRVINEVLDEAEEKQIAKLSVKEWVDDLRDLAYDMEDVLDEFSIELFRRNSVADRPHPVASTSKVRRLIPACCAASNPVSEVKFNLEIGSKIKQISRRLDDISRRKADLGLKGLEKFQPGAGAATAAAAASTWQRPPSTSLIHEPVHGRDGDKKVVVEMLLKDEVAGECNFEVIPIVGIGGMGKTTLAQFIFRDEEIVKHFEPRVWVCVSDESDVEKLTKTVLNAVSPDDVRDGDDFNQVQEKLSENLSAKRFLLVLDDVWNIKSYEQWSELCAPFKSGSRGSKIVLTTRDRNVASLMRADNYHHLLRPLSQGDCWSVFVEHAFQSKNVDEYPILKSIGEKIVKKCNGLPLAAKVVGGLLRSKLQVEAWKHVLDSNIWNSSEYGIMPILRLSYHHLSPHLKRCFAYCALFPKDYKFERKQLILLWMAEGLIARAKNDNRQMEDLGSDYFDELLSRCFFQSLNNDRFVMHDLINDLAQDVAVAICFKLENLDEIQRRIHHLSFIRGPFDVFDKFEVCCQMEKLRTFLALPIFRHNDLKCYLSSKVLSDLLPKLRYLRVLSLSCYEISELPDSIGNLKHLRYLNLSYTALKWLPEAICSLYNLQSLVLCYCRELKKLPTGIANLINLRHLDMWGSAIPEGMPPQIGDMINLRTLSRFFLSKGNGSRIKELKNLLNLQGELALLGLDNVVDPREAMHIRLKERDNINDLTLFWNSYFSSLRNESHEEEVLKWLQPHENLKVLDIQFYGGSVLSSWIGDPSFSKLVRLQLCCCRRCKLLPALGRLPLLQFLTIIGMDEIESIGNEFYGGIEEPFPSLENLNLQDMPKLQDWLSPQLVVRTEPLFPRLRVLVIIKCPKLSSLPDQLPSLVNLNVRECPELTISIPRFPALTFLKVNRCNKAMLNSGVVDVPLLTQLFIEEIVEPSCLWEGLCQPLKALENLGINRCDELTCFRKHESGLKDLSGLQRLWIIRCDKAASLEDQGLPCNLQYLEVKGCSDLTKLPNALNILTSLNDLVIVGCPKVVSLPETGLPPMLKRLSVKHCPSLIGFPNGELPSTLKMLIIEDCQKLESLPEGIMHHTSSICSNNVCHLEHLRVWRCSSLKSIPKGDFPPTLEVLSIWDCNQLETVPGKMLQHLTSLHELAACKCPDIVSSLEEFFIPNLKILAISNVINSARRSLFSEGLKAFTSLEKITIKGPFPDVTSFSDDWSQLLPRSLILLSLNSFYNLKSIASNGIQSFTSLKVLEFYDCAELESFVPKQGLPPSLAKLVICRCPILKKRCLKYKGKDWPKIAHIPYVEIDKLVQ